MSAEAFNTARFQSCEERFNARMARANAVTSQGTRALRDLESQVTPDSKTRLALTAFLPNGGAAVSPPSGPLPNGHVNGTNGHVNGTNGVYPKPVPADKKTNLT